ncbi:MAG TPA: serine hydrolase domain-containing protein [Thermoanaerobaculia bacterium]|nr:serine hydrolase domain-containing protein [Thermoanaerobaculia bacterium]
MTRALLALLLILGQLPVAAATRRRAVQPPAPVVAPPAIVTAARQAAEAALKAGVPAVQIAVSQRGQIIYAEAFGVTDQQSATAATSRSVMQIGSITKQFTAAAILRLAERGALTLDDRIEKFVPEFDPRGATITLRQLLSHTSGVRREWFPPGPPWINLSAPVTREQTIKGLNSGQLLDSPPGTKWSYSNAGYMLAGLAIESITGRSLADFIHTEFALPLGLIDTGVCGTSNLPLPEGYGLPGATWVRMPPFHPTVIWSSGSLCSTASDLARWSHLLATGRAMLPDSYATMITPAKLLNNTVVTYGLGLDVKKMLAQPAAAHGGAVHGFESFLLYFPNQDIAVAVLTNAFPGPASGNPYLMAMAIAKAALPVQ